MALTLKRNCNVDRASANGFAVLAEGLDAVIQRTSVFNSVCPFRGEGVSLSECLGFDPRVGRSRRL